MIALLAVSACAGFEEQAEANLAAKPDARILTLGDSIMWWNADRGGAVADAIAASLGAPVVNLAVPGAAISHPDPAAAAEGLDIRTQYRRRNWEWVVFDGGANDLGDEGGARGCAIVLNELVSADGRKGQIPDLVRQFRADGARVVALGYYDLPSQSAQDGYCGDSLRTLSQRIEIMAGLDPNVLFVSMADVVSPADRSAYDPDGVHPSPRSSQAIGRKVAAAIGGAK